MADLNEDLLLELLTKLPLKPLSRFRCVSKSWDRLISAECIHLRRPLSISAVFYLSGPDADRDPRHATLGGGAGGGGSITPSVLSFFPPLSTSTLVDSCNGLLLFYTYSTTSFYVCNPYNRKWALLPTPSKKPHLSVLAFDPSVSPHYKVVCFTGWKEKGCELEVFRSERMEWGVREVEWGVDTDSMSANMRYFDGKLHILAYPQHLVVVELDDEVAGASCRRMIELPEPAKGEGCFGECGGRRRLHYTSCDGGRMRVWALEEEEKWVLKYSFSVSHVKRCNFLAFDPEVEVVYVWVPGKVVWYDLKERRWGLVCELKGDMEGAYLVQAWLFPCSLFMSQCLMDFESNVVGMCRCRR